MDQLLEFGGRLHPLFVHLPIGFLLIAVVFIWWNESPNVVRISLILGSASALVAVMTGLLLAESGDYDLNALENHKRAGIFTAIVSILLWLIDDKPRVVKWGSLVMTASLLVTGHLGGNLTHGSDYLTAPLFGDGETESPDISKLDLNNAVFYDDAIKPVLQARCYSCHGETKQKGRLRLDNPDLIMKGGKNGKVIAPGNPEESELVKRLDLPVDDEDHMPPKEKKQLTTEEKKLLSLWIESGSDFTKKISESLNEQQLASVATASSDNSIKLPDVDVPAPDKALVTKLTEQGVAITPVAKGSNFLQVNFISVPNEAAELLASMKPIVKNVVILKLNRADVTKLDNFENLITLNLSDTKVDDSVIDQIVKYKNLVSLNLSGTKVTTAGVNKLKSLERLRYLNVYNTSVDAVDLPGVKIEKGNYDVPSLPTDTVVIRTP